MLQALTSLMMIGATSASLGGAVPARPIIAHMSHGSPAAINTPGIRIWTSDDNDVVRRGDRVRVYYRTERDAYVTIFRVDTDGRVHILFPRTPDEENYGYGGATYTVSSAGNGTAFYVDDYDGVGYLFGVASSAPFNYDGLFDDGRWDLHSVSDGRVHGDPLSSLEELSSHLLPQGFTDYDTHLLPYYVEQRYSYPRFVCYDCHSYVPYTSWDPYQAWCRRYTLTIWNDPFYYYPSYWYPTRYYGGTRVVYSSPAGSRYVFKTRDNAAPGIDYRDRRATRGGTAGTGGATPEGRGVRGTDIGGVGSVPAPAGGGRRIAPPLAGGGEPRGEPGRNGDAAPGAVGDGRRRAEAGGLAETPPPAVPMDRGRRRAADAPAGSTDRPSPTTVPADLGRRRADNPVVEIVPRQPETRPQDPGRPATENGARRTTEGAPAQNDQPVSRQVEPRRQDGTETRPPRPDATSRPASPEVRPEVREVPRRQPEATPESKPREAPRTPETPRETPRPQAQPQAQPQERPRQQQPESRPQAQPRAPESRPPSSPPPSPPRSSGSQGHSSGGGGMVRRRP